MSSNKISTKNTNTDNNDNTGLVSVADVTVFRDDCHNKKCISPFFMVQMQSNLMRKM